MAADRAPAFDLPFVVETTPAHVITAVPLKPATRIFVIDPAILPPHREWYRRVYAKIIELRIVPVWTELRAPKPRRRKLVNTVSHVLPTEDAQLEHLFRRELGLKLRIKVPAGGFSAEIDIVRLHQIIDFHAPLLHYVADRSTKNSTPRRRRGVADEKTWSATIHRSDPQIDCTIVVQ